MPIPTDPEERRAYFRMIAAKGGRSRSPEKLAAIRINARKVRYKKIVQPKEQL